MSGHDPTDVLATEHAQEARETAKKRTSRQVSDDVKWVLHDKRGRRFVWRLLESTGVYRSSFTGNSETFFREGERNVGLKILDLIDAHCPERYAEMMKERRDERNATD